MIHKPVELPELQPSRFAGRVASWAEYAEGRYGDSINPVMTYVESGPHRVSWIYHEGEDWRSGERFCTYHIVCDCIAGSRETLRASPSITSWAARAVLRALQRGRPSSTTPIEPARSWPPCETPRPATSSSPNVFHKFAVQTIASILELDARHPEEWPGNVINGEHRVSVLATLFQLHPEVVKWYGRLLEESGVIEDFDGEILRLSPETLAA